MSCQRWQEREKSMKIETLEWDKEKNKLHFLLGGATSAFANAIRKFSMDEVPTLAVEDVEFRDNSSALYDEVVAHRLGLIPIKTDLKSYNLKEECTCKEAGCAKCELKITLKATKKGTVYASESKSKDPKCKFVYPNAPVVKLASRQKIELEATAIMGRGKNHAKWSPALVFFKKEPSLKLTDKSLTDQQKSTIVNACAGIVDLTNNKMKVDKKKLYTSYRFDACLGALENVGCKVEDTDNYIFTVESWGQLDCKEILSTAMAIFTDKLDDLENQIK